MKWNPTLLQLEYNFRIYVFGLSLLPGTDAVGTKTWNLRVHIGPFALRIERGIMGGK